MKLPAIRIAVIQFPGSNCETETARAAERAGMRAEIFRWNRKPEELDKFHGFVSCGRFSYQDQVRAGAVAATEPVMKKITKAGSGLTFLTFCYFLDRVLPPLSRGVEF